MGLFRCCEIPCRGRHPWFEHFQKTLNRYYSYVDSHNCPCFHYCKSSGTPFKGGSVLFVVVEWSRDIIGLIIAVEPSLLKKEKS